MNNAQKSYRHLGLVWLLVSLSFAGCARTPITGKAAQATGEAASMPKAPSDDPASITALETLGAKLNKDGNGNVTSVDFRGTEVSNDDLSHLSGLKSVRNLDLRDCAVTTAGMPVLGGLTSLKALRLSGKSGKTDVTDDAMEVFGKLTNLKVLALDYLKFAGGDEGLSKLSGLTNLEELYAGNTLVNDDSLKVIAENFPKLKKLRVAFDQVSDEGATHIAKLSNLEELDISENSQFFDYGLEKIGSMKQLKKLNCYRLQITDDGVVFLAGLTNLEWLNLDNIGYLSDEGLVHLKDMGKLSFLHIGSNGITDAGLEHLKTLTSLKDLKVTRTNVTEEGVADLQKTLPDTAIQLKYIEGQ